ncbi:phage tail tape measure protein [Pseudacidovorax intermedius]|uniref:phage tail tape measure protein n=1 Tax=Pseudacidovorax intermedius TaxID=433924 RepID=UPI0026EBFBBE|nr:phage tail tape measure protein [Pseudacidovorax intermedius]
MTSFLIGVKLDGDAVGFARMAQQAQKIWKDLTGAGVGSGTATAAANGKALAQMRSDYQRYAQAREVLGVRSERRIQQEIVQTQAAYRRLAESGAMSWREQMRAAEAMRGRVRELRNEMGRLTVAQRAAGLARGVGTVAAGVGAGAAVLTPVVSRVLTYDERLAHMTNTAFNDRNTAGRIAGKNELDKMIQDAVRYGGGTRDNAATALSELLATGAFKPAEATKIFREAVLAGTANDTNAIDFVNIAAKASKTMGIAPERMGAIFGMGTYAGQQGAFEIANMAKWLPQQMSAAKAVGLYGEKGFAKLAAVNQAAINTAGTKDEAGNNVVNLLAKLGSQDTAKDFKKLGIDLPKQLAEGRMKGLDALDVVGNLLDKQLSKDKNYQNVQRQLRTANGDDRRAALEAVGTIAESTVVGKVFQDRQALMGLYGYMQERGRVNEITNGALANTDAAYKNMEVLRAGGSYSVQAAKNESEIALQNAFSGLMSPIKGVADGLTSLAREYPEMTKWTVGSAVALSALAAAAGAAALGATLMGGKGTLGKLGGMVAGLPGMAALGTAGTWTGGALAAGAVGYGVGSLIYKGIENTKGADQIGELTARLFALFGNVEAANAVRINDALKNAQVGGQLDIRVHADPGVAVQQEVRPFNGTQMRVRANTGSTAPEGSW